MKCNKCQKEKDVSEFYIHPTNRKPRRVCKECVIKETKLWREKNPKKLKEQGRRCYAKNKENSWYKERRAKCTKEWYRKNVGRARKIQKKWYDKHGREWARNWRLLNKKKFNVGQITRYAIKIGKLKRPDVCELCGKKTRIVAHHLDYDMPLKVQWLCYSCHKLFHNGLKK